MPCTARVRARAPRRIGSCAAALLVASFSTSARALPGTSPIRPPPVADVRAFGAVGDGVTDDTAAFQAAGGDAEAPARAPHERALKITLVVRVHDSVRGDGSMPKIRMHGTNGQESKSMLSVIDYAGPGLTISGLRLDGGWNEVTANGEWAHNIVVKGSRNVTIENNVREGAGRQHPARRGAQPEPQPERHDPQEPAADRVPLRRRPDWPTG